QVTEQQSDISSVNDEPVQIIDEAALQSINFKLKEDGVTKVEAENREMAKGSAKISSYFSSVTASSASEEAPVETEMQKLQAAYDYLTSELEPKISLESAQQKAGTYEHTKYLAVHLYLELRIDGIKRVQASELAAKRFWYGKATVYLSIVIRKYAAEYIITGKITKGLQGKHSKRISILDDNDIKRKVIEWFRSVPKFQRDIPAIQNDLRHVIIPNAIENNALNVERYSNAVTSIECIRKKLIEWGFHFKRVGRVIFFDGHEREDALVASRMNMGGGEVKEDDVKVRDGRYTVIVDSQSVEKCQSFYVERNFNYPKLQKLRFSKISRADKVVKFDAIMKNVHPVSL
ncbi:hypothetical protein INT48_006753, partial [Thamnidium elegans]